MVNFIKLSSEVVSIQMKPAIVIDTSREIPREFYDVHNIFPIGYFLVDSKNNKHKEQLHIHDFQTQNLISKADKDKKSSIYSPSIKDFVELYTYLAEDFDTLISIHSSFFTPVVFENALVAKKMVSDISIDVIDTPTFGSSSGLFVEELAKTISGAETINKIRKEAITLNKYINSYVLSRNLKLTAEGEEKIQLTKGLKSSLDPYVIHHYFHGNWEVDRTNRNFKKLFKDIKTGIELIYQAKEIKSIYYATNPKFEKEIEDILDTFTIPNVRRATDSLLKYYLIGNNFFEIAFF
jgi:fatty acid-binding protein DegV